MRTPSWKVTAVADDANIVPIPNAPKEPRMRYSERRRLAPAFACLFMIASVRPVALSRVSDAGQSVAAAIQSPTVVHR